MRSAAVLLLLGLAAPAPETPARAERIVYAWFPRNVRDWDTRAIRWDAITHLSYRSVVLQPDGTLREAAPAEKVRELVREARSHGVKVTVLAWGTTKENSSKYLATCPDKVVRSLLDYVKKFDLDGVNIDDETWSEANAETGGPNRELVTAFFRALRSAFDAEPRRYHLSWASPPVVSARDRHGAAWVDYAAVAAEIDAFTVMTYTMNPPTIGWTGASLPLAGGGKVGDHPRDVETAVRDYVEATGGRKEKIVLGISTARGGTEWDCRGEGPRSPIVGQPRPLTAEQARRKAETHGRRFDPEQKAPWYAYRRERLWVQGWYEDDASLEAKALFAREAGLGGLCAWVIDGAAEPPETFAVFKAFLESP